ncbi:ribulose-phosphate 3-epimerase [Microbacterium ginsengiterrae]|uniref:Ribulose-phosphate 3-epimerase n=1 Tax=Microbacterium ginsengiterrae TaxID=546115 RepID=A0A7W9CAP9_9MICO|nr:ribulose-phosphate 3-epimerase [Microbacterium ginsengiterrae]MBB5741951.1 ribulose-phosphate 3-epimerase [Microbacterium ginsengiterrae]
MSTINYSASIMCGDLANLETTIQEIERVGIDALHIDILDGKFSPSMPLGLETVRRVRQVTDLPMDAHIMTMNNEYFVNEMLDIGAESVTFHVETTLHIDRLVNLAKKAGAKVGVALNPATSLSVLEFILPEVDSVCLMLINPGYATDKGEKQVPYALEKVRRLRALIDDFGLNVGLQVDGRVSLEVIPDLVRVGATNLVLGSTSLFIPGRTLEENKRLLDEAVAAGTVS